MGDPETTPAGRYTRHWLRSLEVDGTPLWEQLAGRIAPAADVRAVLGQVRARADLIGVVYRTDLRVAGDWVRPLYAVPPEDAPPIRYLVAQLRDAPHPERAADFRAFLASTAAREIFTRHGFIVNLQP